MKKLLAIGGVIVIIFILIIVLVNKSNETKLKDNPYDTDELRDSTINLIGNKNYSNIILPAELEKKISSGDAVTAYFFSPECGYCLEMTPVLMPIADDMDVHVEQYNLLEYTKEAAAYNIEATPTLIYFKDGVEVNRMVGAQSESSIRSFFSEY